MKKIFVIIIYIFLSTHLHCQSFLELINKHRVSLRLSILTVDSTLTKMARHHTAYLTALKMESTHRESQSVDGLPLLETPSDRFDYFSPEAPTTKYWSECVNYFRNTHTKPSESTEYHFKCLLNSSPHRKIMEDPVIRKIGFSESFYQYEKIDSMIYYGKIITTKNKYNFYTITVCFGK